MSAKKGDRCVSLLDVYSVRKCCINVVKKRYEWNLLIVQLYFIGIVLAYQMLSFNSSFNGLLSTLGSCPCCNLRVVALSCFEQ